MRFQVLKVAVEISSFSVIIHLNLNCETFFDFSNSSYRL